MASIQSQLFYITIKYRHLFRFKLKPEIWDQNTSIIAFREEAERTNARLADKMPKDVEIIPFTIDGMKAEWLIPNGAGKNKAIMYCIGGGYVSGSCSDHRLLVSKVAKNTGAAILLFEHRNAPEDPYPAALEDSLKAYKWLLEQGVFPNNILIMGESAGGGLCLASLLAIRDKKLPLPVAGVALSPWTDLKLTGDSYRAKKNVCISPEGMNIVCSKHYAGDHNPEDPYISPLYGDLRGLPSLFINVGDYETMRDDSVRFAEKAKKAGVDVTLRVGEKMVHCYPLLAPMFPEATEAMKEISEFVKSRLRL